MASASPTIWRMRYGASSLVLHAAKRLDPDVSLVMHHIRTESLECIVIRDLAQAVDDRVLWHIAIVYLCHALTTMRIKAGLHRA